MGPSTPLEPSLSERPTVGGEQLPQKVPRVPPVFPGPQCTEISMAARGVSGPHALCPHTSKPQREK